jgi:UDP-N-acetylmuramoyl-L-alanyl-D-glutamate--2,6-diaminopimelate ligase
MDHRTLREVVPSEARIITVVGCGGDRDQDKRPIMGKIAHGLSDYVIFTSDNPRTEDPRKILDAIVEPLPRDSKYEVVPDRAQAIEKAVDIAEKEDLILIAGKGHENYQIVGRDKKDFSDLEHLKRAFNN